MIKVLRIDASNEVIKFWQNRGFTVSFVLTPTEIAKPAADVIPFIKPVVKNIRPDFSSAIVGVKAKSLVFENSTPLCPVLRLYNSDELTQTAFLVNSEEVCQDCLVYLSKCYCAKGA